MNRHTHVYLSPHLDDAVLSCGGRIWQQVRAGERVRVVTVFAAAPRQGVLLSPFAQELHARWGHPADAIARRQEEDMSALGLLGAEAVHWPYTDCIYRQVPESHFLYDCEEALWGEIHPAEEALVAELAARLAVMPSKPGIVIYAPLAAGHHVDHRVVRRAAEASGCVLLYYEDFPYAKDSQELQAAHMGRQWQEELVRLSGEALEAKIEAIACYCSQISTFWADAAEMAEQVRAFAERSGGGRPAERYWKSSGSWPSPPPWRQTAPGL